MEKIEHDSDLELAQMEKNSLILDNIIERSRSRGRSANKSGGRSSAEPK